MIFVEQVILYSQNLYGIDQKLSILPGDPKKVLCLINVRVKAFCLISTIVFVSNR